MPHLLRQERGAQSHPAHPRQWETEQGNRQDPGQVAQPQPLPQSLTHTAQPGASPCCPRPQSKPHCQQSKIYEGNIKGWAHSQFLCFPCFLSIWLFLPSILSSITFFITFFITILFSVACLSHLSLVPKSCGHFFPFSLSHPPAGCQFPCSHLRLFPLTGDWQLPTI